MKILVISSKYPPEYAGSAWRAHNTYKRLRAKFGIDYDVVCNSTEYNDNATYEYDGVCVRRLCSKWGQVKGNGVISKIINHFIYLVNFIYVGFLTWRILKAGNYDLIHTFGSSISVNVAMLYAKNKNIGLLRELCNEGTYPRPMLPLKLDKIFKYRFWPKSKVVAISKQVADLCRQDCIDESTLWERPNPVDEKKFKPSTETKYDLRNKLTKFTDDDKVLVDISKFMPRKNKKFLVEVMKYLEEEYKLLIFGPIISSGPLFERDKKCYDEIINSIKENKLDDRIQVVTGFSENIEEYFQLADVFVFPTLSEALGTSMLESIACQVPVVVNRIKGVTDQWVKDGQTGFVCDLNPKEFAAYVVKAAQIDHKLLKQGGEEILAKASAKVIDEQYFKLMRDLIGLSSN